MPKCKRQLRILSVIQYISQSRRKHKNLRSKFFTERLVKKTKSTDDTLYKKKLPLFSYKPPLKSKHSSDISTLKEKVKLFSHLYVANQRRNCNMGNFFSHENTENTSVPPSLSKDGKVRSGGKADLLDSLCERCNTQNTKVTVVVLQLKVQFQLICIDLQGREHLRNTLKKDLNHFFKRNQSMCIALMWFGTFTLRIA